MTITWSQCGRGSRSCRVERRDFCVEFAVSGPQFGRSAESFRVERINSCVEFAISWPQYGRSSKIFSIGWKDALLYCVCYFFVSEKSLLYIVMD